MLRRDFVATGLLAAVGTSLNGSSAPARKVAVGAHPWVYAARLPGYDITPSLDQIFSDISWAGFDALELMHTALYPDGAVEQIARLSERYRLPILGASYGADFWRREAHQGILVDSARVVDRLAQLGGRTLGVSVGRASARKSGDQLDAQAELLQQVSAVAAEHGIVLNLHNHTYEVEEGMYDLRGTLERFPDAKLGPDLNWLIRGGIDPVWFIRTYGRQLVFLHLRDQHENGRWSEALGEGDTDFAAIGKALREIDFSGDAVIELAHENDFEPTRPIRESLRISREYVRSGLGF